MADISDHGPTITKKGNFDGWYKYLKKHFGIKFPFFGNFDGLYKQ